MNNPVRDVRAAHVRDDVLWFLDTTFAAWNWAHKSMRDALDTLSVPEANWQPSRHTHPVWEQIHHVAHWKAYVVERIRGRRTRAHQAWPRAGRTRGELRRSIARLTRLHRDLRAALTDMEAEAFVRAKIGRYALVRLLLGAAAHESYHAGQILLTRKLYRDFRRSSRTTAFTPPPLPPSASTRGARPRRTRLRLHAGG